MIKPLNRLINTSRYTLSYFQRLASSAHLFFVKMSEKSDQGVAMGKTHRYSKEERKQMLKQRRQEKKAAKQVGFDNLMLNQTQYYFENGFRKVYPYYYGWNTTAKERWSAIVIIPVVILISKKNENFRKYLILNLYIYNKNIENHDRFYKKY